jgi:hypothetical protein
MLPTTKLRTYASEERGRRGVDTLRLYCLFTLPERALVEGGMLGGTRNSASEYIFVGRHFVAPWSL